MKNILIMGGSGGIGSQLTKNLVIDNHITVADINQQKLDDLSDSISNNNLRTIQVDVSNRDGVKKMFESLGGLDVLINCAAILKPVGLFLDNDLDQWKKNIEVSLLGTVYCCYYGLLLLLKAEHGKIINFGGGGAAYGRLGHTAYASSKTAIVRLTEILAMEYPDIDINVIAPGAFKTGMWKDETFEEKPDKWGDIKTLIKFIRFLISEKSNGLTGRFLHYKDNLDKVSIEKLEDYVFTLRRIDNFMFERKK